VVGIRKQIEWGIDDMGTPGDPSDDELIREETDLGDNGDPVPSVAVRSAIITRGCLHFGVWLEMAEAHRVIVPGSFGPDFRWESTNGNEEVLPFKGTLFDTRNKIPASASFAAFYPQPDALRVSLVLTGGGRFATRGTLIGQLDLGATEARITGIKALPTISGSLLRIGDEWVRYDDFQSGGRIKGVRRGQMRTADSVHSDRSLVLAGQPFSLVVALPR